MLPAIAVSTRVSPARNVVDSSSLSASSCWIVVVRSVSGSIPSSKAAGAIGEIVFSEEASSSTLVYSSTLSSSKPPAAASSC